MTSEQECRRIVWERSAGGRCELCGRSDGHGLHHRAKRSQGGTWDPANILRLCGSGTRGCHGWVEANPSHAHRLGLWLRTGDGEPHTVPAWIATATHVRDWWLLHPDGTFGFPQTLPAEDRATAAAQTMLRLDRFPE